MFLNRKRIGSAMAAFGLMLTIAACSPAQPGDEADRGSGHPVESGSGGQDGDHQPGTTQPGESGVSEMPAQDADLSDLPSEKEGTIQIEGMDESVTLKLFDHSQYVTYHPVEMIAEPDDSGEGDSVRFIANFGGQRNDDAFVHFFLYPDGTSKEEALTAASDLAEQFGSGVKEVAAGDRYYPWALAEYMGHVGDMSVTIGVGEHGDQYYQVLTHYPLEYGDGMGPRVNLILSELLWKDTGKGLGE